MILSINKTFIIIASIFYIQNSFAQYNMPPVEDDKFFDALNQELEFLEGQRSERSSDLGTCYIIMLGKFFSSCHTSNPKIRKKLVAIKMMLLAMKKFILHATTFSNQKMRGIFLCLQL